VRNNDQIGDGEYTSDGDCLFPVPTLKDACIMHACMRAW
jgi:hypothetical protein